MRTVLVNAFEVPAGQAGAISGGMAQASRALETRTRLSLDSTSPEPGPAGDVSVYQCRGMGVPTALAAVQGERGVPASPHSYALHGQNVSSAVSGGCSLSVRENESPRRRTPGGSLGTPNRGSPGGALTGNRHGLRPDDAQSCSEWRHYST
jgi:hypothetical protein